MCMRAYLIKFSLTLTLMRQSIRRDRYYLMLLWRTQHMKSDWKVLAWHSSQSKCKIYTTIQQFHLCNLKLIKLTGISFFLKERIVKESTQSPQQTQCAPWCTIECVQETQGPVFNTFELQMIFKGDTNRAFVVCTVCVITLFNRI